MKASLRSIAWAQKQVRAEDDHAIVQALIRLCSKPPLVRTRSRRLAEIKLWQMTSGGLR